MTVPKWITPADIPGLLQPGLSVYVPGLAGQSAVFVETLSAAPEAAAGVRFVGVWLPGTNRVDWAGLHADARADAFFIYPELAGSFAAGRITFRPLSYFQVYRYLETQQNLDLALLQTSPPDSNGELSLGIANDFTPAILSQVRRIAVHINPRMPVTQGSARIPLSRCDWCIEQDAPLLSDGDGVDPAFDAIGRHVATLIRDGDTLEVGVGRVQRVLPMMRDARKLRLHSGAATTPALALFEGGSLAEDDNAVTLGVALGSATLYERMGSDPRVRFAPVGYTHHIATLAAIPRFVAINSVIEVDLLGQANAEMIRGRQVSSAGGIVDFMRGARASAGGRAIVALPAATKDGARSRIVPAFPPGTAVSIARADMDLVVTEHGIADLRTASIDDRAERLIAIAAPAFREELARAWYDRRRAM